MPRAYSRAAFAAATLHDGRVAKRPLKADISSMDAPNPSAIPTFASRTPLHVGAVGLKVRDLARLTGFTATCSALPCSTAARTARRSARRRASPPSRASPRRQARRPAHRGPLSHRSPDADARRSGALDDACGEQQGAADRRLRSRGERGVLPRRSRGQRHRGLSRPAGGNLAVDQWRLEDDHRSARHRRYRAGSPARRGLSGRARRLAHRPRASARRRRRPSGNVLSRCARPRRHAPPAWCDLHVVGALSPPHRRQRLAQRRRGAARREPRRTVLAIARSRRCARLEAAEARLARAGVKLTPTPAGVEAADPGECACASRARNFIPSTSPAQASAAAPRRRAPWSIHRRASRGRAPPPAPPTSARNRPSPALGLGPQRRQCAGRERKLGRQVRHGPDVTHHAVDKAARRAAGHQIGQRRAVVARRRASAARCGDEIFASGHQR